MTLAFHHPIIRPSASRKIEELVVEALVSCLNEMESVSSALLAVLLQSYLGAVSSRAETFLKLVTSIA